MDVAETWKQVIKVIETYRGSATGAGSALGITIVDSELANKSSYQGQLVKILDGDAAGQVRPIATHVTSTLTVANAFTDSSGSVVQITIGTHFTIISLGGGASAPPPVAPSIGLWMFGVCDPAMSGSTTALTLTNLAGFPNDLFNNEFWIQVIHNANSVGNAPEGEIRRVTDYVGATGAFTCDAFSVNVEANDLVCVFHESILSREIVGRGVLDTSSATAPADSSRSEANNFFNGCLLMTTEGAGAFQPRRIVDYTGAGGIFTLDPNNPFTAVPGTVDYIIIGSQCEFVPAADGANNRTPSDVVGRKDDTADYTPGATTSSIVRLVKGLLGARVIAEGTLTTSSATVPADTGRTEADIDYFKGCILMPLTGSAAFQPRPIRGFTPTTDVFTLDEPFTSAPGTVAYVILSSDYPAQRLIDIGDTVDAALVLTQALNTTQTVKNSSIALFALDALGGPKKDVRVEFWLDTDGAATFTPNWYVTRQGAPVTFVARLIPAIATIATPGAAGRYYYEYGDLPEGGQLEFRVAQDNAGAANVDIDGVLTYLSGV